MLAVSSYPPGYVKQSRANIDHVLKAYKKVATATSLTVHDGILTVEKSIRLNPETSVLGLEPGDPIALDVTTFTTLANPYFDEIEARYT